MKIYITADKLTQQQLQQVTACSFKIGLLCVSKHRRSRCSPCRASVLISRTMFIIIVDHFLGYLIYKMSEIVKNVFKCLFLSTTQRCSVYLHRGKKKTEIIHINQLTAESFNCIYLKNPSNWLIIKIIDNKSITRCSSEWFWNLNASLPV